MKTLSVLALILIASFCTTAASARTTPEDILNSQKQAYQEKVQGFSLKHQQQLEDLSQKIAGLNKKITDDLEKNTLRQGQILDEYTRRNNIQERSGDGISRNLSDPVENARYWLTFANEAIAYQAAKIYIFNLTSETNIKNDASATIFQLQSDINILSSKVAKSQKIIKQLVKNN